MRERLDIHIPDNVRQDIIARTSLHADESNLEPFNLGVLLDNNTLSYLIQLYFNNFHSAHPFVDKSLLCIPVWSWCLCLATAGVGARFAGIDEATDFGDSLCALVYRLLTQELTAGTIGDSLPYLQARVLSVIGMCHSRRSSLVDCGYSGISLICHSCLRLRLLNEDDRIGQREAGQCLDQVWTAWKFREMRRRTGLFIWLIDATIAFIIRSPPKLRLDLLNLKLPSSEETWNADNYEQWFAIVGPSDRSEWFASSFETEEKSRMTVRNAVAILRSRRQAPEGMSDFTLSIMAQVLIRRHWDADQYLIDALDHAKIENHLVLADRQSRKTQSQYLGAIPEHIKWRNHTCDCLDVLHRDALSVSARAMSHEGSSFLHLHLSRLFILVPLKALFDCADSLVMSDYSLPHNLYTALEENLECAKTISIWLKRDRYKARLAVVHAGAIFWHLRRYPSDSFLEPFSIFLAALALWAYSRFNRDSSRDPSVNAQRTTNQNADHGTDWNGVPTYDVIEGHHNDITTVNQTVTSRGPRKPSLMVLDRPVDDELVQFFIRSGDSIKLLLEGTPDLCSHDGPRQVLLEAVSMLNEYANTWKVSMNYGAYLKTLAGTPNRDISADG